MKPDSHTNGDIRGMLQMRSPYLPLPSCVGRFETVVVVLIQTTKVSTPLTAKCLAGISRFG
jgi:hypothetical protein